MPLWRRRHPTHVTYRKKPRGTREETGTRGLGMRGFSAADRKISRSVDRHARSVLVSRRLPCGRPGVTLVHGSQDRSRRTMTIKRILVPTDFSEGSAAALKYAVELASHFPATVHLLHIVEPGSTDCQRTTVGKPKEMQRLRAARRRLHNAIPRIAGVQFGIDRDVRVGGTVDQIVQCAREELADLIVMRCSHASTGASRGECTVERVARRAPCPVVTLPIALNVSRSRVHGT